MYISIRSNVGSYHYQYFSSTDFESQVIRRQFHRNSIKGRMDSIAKVSSMRVCKNTSCCAEPKIKGRKKQMDCECEKKSVAARFFVCVCCQICCLENYITIWSKLTFQFEEGSCGKRYIVGMNADNNVNEIGYHYNHGKDNFLLHG